MMVQSRMIANHVTSKTHEAVTDHRHLIDQTNLSAISPQLSATARTCHPLHAPVNTTRTARTYKLLDGRQQTRVVKFLTVLTYKQLHFGYVMMDDVSDA